MSEVKPLLGYGHDDALARHNFMVRFAELWLKRPGEAERFLLARDAELDALKASQAPLPQEIAEIEERHEACTLWFRPHDKGPSQYPNAAQAHQDRATLLRALKARPVWDREKLLEWNESVVLACGFMDAVKPDAVKEGWWAPHDDNVRQRLSAFLQDFDAILAAQPGQLGDVEREFYRSTIEACAKIFREYEELHLAKSPPDQAKAARNGEHAQMCQRALMAAFPKSGLAGEPGQQRRRATDFLAAEHTLVHKVEGPSPGIPIRRAGEPGREG